jgi:hypothetical protein
VARAVNAWLDLRSVTPELAPSLEELAHALVA